MVVVMTAVESLPDYTEAETMAARRDNNTKGVMFDYMSETPQPDDTVLCSETDWAVLRDELHGGAK